MKEKMKKVWFFLMILMTAGILAGCSDKKNVTMDVSEAADKLKSDISFKDSLNEADDDMFYDIYDMDSADVAKKKAYISGAATAEEIAAVEAKDEKAAQRVKEAFETRIEDQKESFKSYVPEEMPKLNDPVLVVEGKYVILCISNDNKKAKEIINGLGN